MISISIKQLLSITKGVLYSTNEQHDLNLCINTIIINSRQHSINSLFIALKGNFFDGHSFVKEAISNGTIILLVEKWLNIKCPQIIVNDTYLAMGKLAAWIRSQSSAQVIGITGSSGKTSVKEMVSNILSQLGMTLFTKGNFNNKIGVPLTLFRLTEKYNYIVVEIGANHFHEIEYITNIVKPNSVLINNLYSAHLEGFGSLNGVAKAKGEILYGLSKKGTVVINLDSHNWKTWSSYINEEQIIWWFSLRQQKYANFYAKNIVMQSIGSEFELHTPFGFILISLSLPGIHNIANAIAASALAISVGATIEQVSYGLAQVKPIFGRLYPIYLTPSKLILDDTYNSNVGSMVAAIDVLSNMPGYRILVVGDMNELGNKSLKFHFEIGVNIKHKQINQVLSIGQYSYLISQYSKYGEHFISKKKLIERLILLIQEYEIISVLIKGSRSTAMEEIVHSLQEYFLC
ncbi:UDP-N-acetylmuramoyl-tripeptide--D-alanyl-D- alanine ligase [Candidatus Arsenophonus lipoptenae]|uniref:UDP-N-acetylmuramoyl-tripeptide--D-alanyl-D-alanine ligase n=1 Tax=Candidatus Arsenophonus lipoptenae TaxID=634113 RepID=A0A120HPX7_9GAMM|nr:UDP-N-acetylmuramoyl-tripeptide--D-alanyl-D-alanine ligase [Candidatus Arsenophonus lipoptenae]AMA65098.1 UDP-N-acetylmuramoyl-tripeptide--D-alanyl-D- alanine ligase [Candidatus Arsenophonus lipoptenae]